MKCINKRLIVSDYDGTLLTSENTVPDEVRSAINEYVACGGIFAVCTGRMLRSILPRVRELGLKGLVVACQGTVIAEIGSGKLIKNDSINHAETAEICRFIEGLKLGTDIKYGINTYRGDDLYTDIRKGDKHLAEYERITGVNAAHVNIPMSEFVTKNALDCQKITCLVSPGGREELYHSIAEKFNKRFDVTCSASVLVEISPLNDTKGEALKYIAKHYGIPMASTVAVGDNLNDLSMIVAADIGVAVGNAVQGLKDAANYITVTNNEGAVAKIIEKFGFK